MLKLLCSIVLIFFCAGCATAIKYNVDKNQYKDVKSLNYKAIVDVIEDCRGQEEHEGYFLNKHEFFCTNDKSFKQGIDKQVSQMLVNHLKATKLFNGIELRNVDNDLDKNIQEMEMLKNNGIDFVIIGNLKHFNGFQSQSSTEVIGMMFGLVGTLTDMLANPRTVGGNVEYSDVKIIDTGKEKILWEGSIAHEFKEKDTFYDGQNTYALRALKEANNKFAKQLREICEGYQNNPEFINISAKKSE